MKTLVGLYTRGTIPLGFGKIILSQEEIIQAQLWVQNNQQILPPEVYKAVFLVASLQKQLITNKQKSAALLQELRQAMGIIPQSERTNISLTSNQEQGPQPVLSPEMQKIKEERDRLTRHLRRYRGRVSIRQKHKRPRKSKQPLAGPGEKIFSGCLGEGIKEENSMSIDRQKEFERSKGLHSSKDARTRFEYQVQTKEITLLVETVTDPLTGKSVTASTDEIGPPQFQVTWKGLANTIISVMGYAIPINRLSTMITPTCPYFTSSRLCKLLEYSADLVAPIYQHLGESLANSDILSGDDTSTLVLDIKKKMASGKSIGEPKPGLITQLAECFGRTSLIKSGKREQKNLNVSVVVGKTVSDDPKSYIFFFRTHVGHLGNLLSKIIELRLPRNKKLTIQSDLSSSNNVNAELYQKFEISHAGCSSHSRRPFWRFKEQDPQLCYWMLNAFLLLKEVEEQIDEYGRDFETVLYYRQKFARKVWQAILKRCQNVLKNETKYSFLWPPSSKLYLACQYIVDNYKKLTLYLDDPRLFATNNLCERLLRWDKIMLDSSHFRATERGRLNVDILRTLLHTCAAAEVNLDKYLLFVFKHREELKNNPADFTPYAFSLKTNVN